MNKQKEKSDLTQLLDSLKLDVMKGINAVQIGIIESFDTENLTASIRLALKQVKQVNADGSKELVEHPLLACCPVMILYGGSSYLTMPIAPGDECLVLFNDREIDNWFAAGGVQTPTTSRIHDLSDGIAIVGIRSLQHSIANYLTNGIRLASGSTKIDLTSGAINTLATLFTHTGNMMVTGTFAASSISAGNGASGTFGNVTVVNGIVTGGS